jgi:hypothetical protein
LMERLRQHEADLADLSTPEPETEQISSNEATEEEQSGEQEPDAKIIQRVREAAVEDAIQHAREQYSREQQQAHLLPAPSQLAAEAEAIRAQARPAFATRMAELTKGIDIQQLTVNIPIPRIVEDALLTLPGGPEATLYLAQHPAEGRKLQGMPEHLALARVAQLTARLNPDFQRRPTSNAPPPISPLRGSSTKSSVPADQMSYQDYRTWRDKQEKQRYRR